MINNFPGGRVPYEMELISTAKYLGVAPWDLENQEYKWLDYGGIMQAAEGRASNATYTTTTF